MNPGDIPSGLLLCRTNNWNQLPRDWKLFFEISPHDCRVAIEGEKITGSVTTISYQHLFCWIGMLLVDPAYQRKGIGKQLLNEALVILKNEETVKLDATPAGRKLYLQLNFTDEYPLIRMQAGEGIARLPTSYAKPLKKIKLEKLFQQDELVFGANREFILRWLWEGANEYAFIMEDNSRIIGYCFGRRGFKFNQIGPVIADNIQCAKNLVAAALSNCCGQPVILDVLLHTPEWIQWLKEIGFTEERTFIRMYNGLNRFPGIPGKQYAIAGPEYG
jgi:GNAT superfamily N-acetyltransferase